MTEPVEPTTAERLLRQANPVPDPRRSFPRDHPAVSALCKEITMSDTLTGTPTPSSPTVPGPRSGPRRWARPLLAAAAVAAAVFGTVAITGAGDDDSQPLAESPGGPVSSSASCVETYSLETLAGRETAFDGTVASIAGDQITFQVRHWYRGGSESTVTLGGALVLTGHTSAGAPTTLEPGTRMLVAGDGGFAWSCGFTQPYNADVAAQWEAVLS